jgi:ACT domain-containing protein
MNAITKATRINNAIQVIQRMNDGLTVVAACDEVGLARSSFYHIIKKYPEAIAEYQEMVKANAKVQLGMILLNKTEILQKVIADGLSEETAPRDRLTIYKVLSELEDKLTHALPETNKYEAAAREFLSRGVELRPGVSRLTATQTTIDIECED